MTPASPPPAPNPFRTPRRPQPRLAPVLWLALNRHASEGWHLVEGNIAQDPSLRWGDEAGCKSWIH